MRMVNETTLHQRFFLGGFAAHACSLWPPMQSKVFLSVAHEKTTGTLGTPWFEFGLNLVLWLEMQLV